MLWAVHTERLQEGKGIKKLIIIVMNPYQGRVILCIKWTASNIPVLCDKVVFVSWVAPLTGIGVLMCPTWYICITEWIVTVRGHNQLS